MVTELDRRRPEKCIKPPLSSQEVFRILLITAMGRQVGLIDFLMLFIAGRPIETRETRVLSQIADRFISNREVTGSNYTFKYLDQTFLKNIKKKFTKIEYFNYGVLRPISEKRGKIQERA